MTRSADVTRRQAVFSGTRISVTGHRTFSYSDSTIEMLIFPRGSSQFYTPAGYYAKIDALGQSVDPILEFDQVLTDDGRRYEVEYTHDIWDLSDNFVRRDSALRLVPAWQAEPASATWETTPADPRSTTKTFINLRVFDGYITKNDGVTQAAWECIFSNPPYHLIQEFRAEVAPVEGLYVVDQPVSTALVGAAPEAYGYEEEVPIHVCTVDSSGCEGEQLRWKMEAELRRIMEVYPEGSRRNLNRRSDNTYNFGSDRLYDTTWTLTYRRTTA